MVPAISIHPFQMVRGSIFPAPGYFRTLHRSITRVGATDATVHCVASMVDLRLYQSIQNKWSCVLIALQYHVQSLNTVAPLVLLWGGGALVRSGPFWWCRRSSQPALSSRVRLGGLLMSKCTPGTQLHFPYGALPLPVIGLSASVPRPTTN